MPRRRPVAVGGRPLAGQWRVREVRHHPYATAVKLCLLSLRLEIVRSQVAVHDSTAKVATAVDLLCRDRAGGVVVVEVKVCAVPPEDYRQLLARVGPRPRDPAGGVAKTHQVQLGLTRLFYDRCNPRAKSCRGLVVCTGKDGARAYELNPRVWAACPSMCKELVDGA